MRPWPTRGSCATNKLWFSQNIFSVWRTFRITRQDFLRRVKKNCFCIVVELLLFLEWAAMSRFPDKSLSFQQYFQLLSSRRRIRRDAHTSSGRSFPAALPSHFNARCSWIIPRIKLDIPMWSADLFVTRVEQDLCFEISHACGISSNTALFPGNT